MSRLRATTAPSELDRAIAQHVDRAVRELESAARLAHSGRRASYRARRVERDLARALSAAQQVGTVAPRFGEDDPDMVSEEERARLAREQREQERKAEREAAVAERGEG